MIGMPAEPIRTDNFDSSRPIYTVGISIHQSGSDRRIHVEYNQAARESSTPLIGHWRSDKLEYTDISYPFQAESDDEARVLAKCHGQESLMKIHPDGRIEFVEV